MTDPEVSENERRLQRGYPRAPKRSSLIPRGMVGYDEFKHRMNLEAWRDRQASRPECDPEIRRLALIAKLCHTFPHLDVGWIADQVDPWNLDRFKRLVVAAQTRYLKERNE